ncbi:hypothetical protein EDC94DRAFT_375908 [Helicostylum pulchrum]|nr:hypothetical protein EDC94DRAFT_375908 [Helicostylum pulchrum]
MQQYIKAVIDLHTQHRRNNGTIPQTKVRGPLVTAFLDTYSREKAKEKRDFVEDCSDDTLGDGYDEDDYQRIGGYFFKNKNNAIDCR